MLVPASVVFQSTHPSGVRLLFFVIKLLKSRFQSTHPSGVRHTCPAESTSITLFQSTHPSGVRRAMGVDIFDAPNISIHAPQWGATRSERGQTVFGGISIHAPQWGATGRAHRRRHGMGFQSTHPSGVRLGWPPTPPKETINFNPRTPVGCDDRRRRHHPSIRISIHAPQWGATGSFPMRWRNPTNFNPRTPVGCDAVVGYVHLRGAKFQSTHPSGVRPQALAGAQSGDGISIHAPQWGATPAQRRNRKSHQRFQSTHPSGVRPTCSATRITRTMCFNPRTPVGCDQHHGRSRPRHQVSIHAPQWGATAIASRNSMGVVFQSTHPSGVRLREWA